jgi:hypothetical protein
VLGEKFVPREKAKARNQVVEHQTKREKEAGIQT